MTNARPRISIVEDDPEIRRLLVARLEKEEFRVDAADGGSAFDKLVVTKGYPDLVVLDIMLPGEDGFSICRRIRAQSQVPIIMLTARGDDIDRIVGLELGADDYVPKPFNPRELIARIRAVLRRMVPPPVKAERYRVGTLEIDMGARLVALTTGGTVELTAGEFDLLACFLTRPQRVLSREQLIEWTRGRDADPFDRTIDVQMSRLRRKLADAGADNFFKTVRNAGYVLTESTRL
jgi:two-component system OmpR family response regulator